MAKGNCGLCKQWRKLCDSHLLPEAIYGYLRFGDDGIKSSQAPFVLDDTSSRRDFTQIKKPFLCSDCETRFNGGGESWVLENCLRKPGQFPLEERLRKALGRTRWPGGWIVYADDFPKLHWERLAYFAVSIFWRAGVTDWKVGAKRVELPLPSRHEQDMRKYLLGEAHFQIRRSYPSRWRPDASRSCKRCTTRHAMKKAIITTIASPFPACCSIC